MTSSPSLRTEPLARLTNKDFRSYGEWALELWRPSVAGGEGASFTVRDFAVMGLGLSGELSEVLFALDAGSGAQEPPDLLLKELGDVAYHIGTLSRMCDVELEADCLPHASDWQVEAGPERESQAYRLVRPAGAVADLLKKYLRDDAPSQPVPKSAAVATGLQQVLDEWAKLCCLCGISPAEALALNQAKLNSRFARGTLGGSGDER